jgi:two-component system chemotaxis response regulator CheY
MEEHVLALVIDDSRAVRQILIRILRRLGFDTVQADNGRTGLETLRALEALPDVVLVDWNMPEVDGLEFVAAVRAEARWRDIALMMVSAEGESGRIVQALAAGAHEYVIKPFTPDAIVEKLRLLGLVKRSPTAMPANHQLGATGTPDYGSPASRDTPRRGVFGVPGAEQPPPRQSRDSAGSGSPGPRRDDK